MKLIDNDAYLSARRKVMAVGGLAFLAACTPAVTAKITTSVEQVIADLQAFTPYIQGLAIPIAAIYPAAAPFLPLIENALTGLGNILNTMTTTMTSAAGQKAVAAAETYASGALTALSQMSAAITTSGTVQAKINTAIADAQAILPLLDAFVNGTATAIAGAEIAPLVYPAKLYIRQVK